jgi:hypothetical protein
MCKPVIDRTSGVIDMQTSRKKCATCSMLDGMPKRHPWFQRFLVPLGAVAASAQQAGCHGGSQSELSPGRGNEPHGETLQVTEFGINGPDRGYLYQLQEQSEKLPEFNTDNPANPALFAVAPDATT